MIDALHFPRRRRRGLKSALTPSILSNLNIKKMDQTSRHVAQRVRSRWLSPYIHNHSQRITRQASRIPKEQLADRTKIGIAACLGILSSDSYLW